MTRRVRFLLIAATVAAASCGARAETAATWTFAAGGQSTCPGTVKTSAGKITVDLSAIPKGAKVFRAVLRLDRAGGPGWMHEADRAIVTPAGSEQALPLRAPRYASLDATQPVAEAVAGGAGKVELLVKSLGGWKPQTTRLEVSLTGGKAKGKIPKVAGLQARHRGGQTLLTWTQPGKFEDKPLTVGTWKAYRQVHAEQVRGLSFRIYRSAKPITAASIAAAELVDEVGPWTCWNTEFHGRGGRKNVSVFRYVAEDGAKPVPPGTGIYAHNPAKPGKAHYAVTAAAFGQEDFAGLGEGNSLPGPVEEVVGAGDPILQRIEKPKTFFYTDRIALHYYTRWEAPPRCNLPSRPYDYLVIVPAKLVKPAPLNVILHCWGSNLYGTGGAYSWHGWKDKRRGIGVASNQDPYDWWTTYHENAGTWRPWTDGVTRNFTPDRLLAFVDWVAGKWDVDKGRMCVSGESMGGSGSTFMPIRYPGRFAYAYSAVGIHNPGAIGGGFHESYARTNGRMKLPIKHASGMDAWDYLSDSKLVRDNPKANLPFIGFGNGKNDGGIGWPQAVDLAKALQEARQPHGVVWNLRGHGAGSFYPPIDFRTDQSLPAFTQCSLDDDIGTATRLKEPKPFKHPWGQVSNDLYDGDPQGGINTRMRWKTDDIIDEPARWALTVLLAFNRREKAAEQCTVNITPRRLQKLRVAPGAKFKWTSTPVEGGGKAQSGTAVADKWGLVTMEKVAVHRTGSRVELTPAR